MSPASESAVELELPSQFDETLANLLHRPWWQWALFILCIAFAAALAVYVWPRAVKWFAQHKAKRSTEEPRGLAEDELRKAWRLFLAGVPTEQQITLGKFEHIVVTGPARSGKRELIDRYSDYLARSNQGVKSLAEGNSLQVYMGSGVLITELPGSLLSDEPSRVNAALTALWKPLYADTLPVFVVVLDVLTLMQSTDQEVDTLAQKLRGQANALSAVGKRPVRIRVVANNLGQQEGWDELAGLFNKSDIPLHIPLPTQPSEVVGPQKRLKRWLEAAREQLPRALKELDAAAYFKVVRFLRVAETGAGTEMFDKVGSFVNELFRQEAHSLAPINEGIFLAAAAGSKPNPLRDPDVHGRLRNPYARHFTLAAPYAAAFLALCLVFKVVQGSSLRTARANLDAYLPRDEPVAWEKVRLGPDDTITSEASSKWWPFELQANVRAALRRELSDRLRNVFISRLKAVDDAPAVLGPAWLRIASFLALIHSDDSDYFDIESNDSLYAWTQATDLPASLIKTYIQATDTALDQPIENLERRTFKLDEANNHDEDATWFKVIQAGLDGMNEPLSADDLERLARRARSVEAYRADPTAERTALEIFASLDDARAFKRVSSSTAWQTKVTTSRSAQLCARADGGETATKQLVPAGKLETAYAPLFNSHPDSARYQRLCKQHKPVMAVLEEIAHSSIPSSNLVQLSALNQALERLVEPSVAASKTSYQVELERKPESTDKFITYSFDVAAWRKRTVEVQAAGLIDKFLAADNADIFGITQAPSGLPVTWNTSLLDTGPFVGRGAIPYVYSRSYYERFVRGELMRYLGLQKRLDALRTTEAQNAAPVGPATEAKDQKTRQMSTFLSRQVQAYALGYVQALRGFAADFDVAPSLSPTALSILLTQLAAESSPFSYFVSAVADQAAANTDGEYFTEMQGALGEFAGWRAMNDGKGGGELQKYRAILAQLALELGPATEETAGPASDDSASVATLEASLSPLGRVALRELLGKKGAYRPLIAQWVDSVKLPANQALPFLRPLGLLRQIGASEITQAVSVAWRRELRPGLVRIAHKFPFDPQSADDVTPEELAAELDPLNGRFFAGVRSFVEPISVLGAGRPFSQNPALTALVTVPADMYPTINTLAGLSARLFDAQGKPKPLSVTVRTVPLTRSSDRENALTAAFVGVDGTSFYAFNQRTTEGALPIDWTREQIAQVGGQYTHLSTRRTTFSEPVASPSSYWSFFRLLQRAEVDPTNSRVGGTTYTWRIAGPNLSSKPDDVRFRVVNDPLGYFSLPLNKSEIGAGS